jgi:hypothetical protein
MMNPARNRGTIIVEGHGEVEAAANLITRLGQSAGVPGHWAKPLRWANLHQWEAQRRGGVQAAAEFARARPDTAALLILRDEDDACPARVAPEMAKRLESLKLPFPTVYVLLKPEYEVLFLPCLDRMSDLGFPPSLGWDHDSWEARRGVKEWLSAQLPRGRSYKPTTLQLDMTQRLDLATLEAADVPSFGSLQRAVRFLSIRWGQSTSEVYPQ